MVTTSAQINVYSKNFEQECSCAANCFQIKENYLEPRLQILVQSLENSVQFVLGDTDIRAFPKVLYYSVTCLSKRWREQV